MHHQTVTVGDLTAVIGNNEKEGAHRAGYNGLWSLKHRECPRDFVVPNVAGLNLEHILNGETENEPDYFFEPRRAPMDFRKISDAEVELHQPPTPHYHLESWTRFAFKAPHYIDMTFRCMAHQHVFHRDFIGLFWASYINGPDDKSIYFLGKNNGEEAWHQFCTQRHNDESTVRHREDNLELKFVEGMRPALFNNLSPLRFERPFYYGNFENLVWVVMFEPGKIVRFSHSPSGGGFCSDRKTDHPAWDFQWIIPRYEVMKSYTLRVRALLRPKCSRGEILREFEAWKPE